MDPNARIGEQGQVLGEAATRQAHADGATRADQQAIGLTSFMYAPGSIHVFPIRSNALGRLGEKKEPHPASLVPGFLKSNKQAHRHTNAV